MGGAVQGIKVVEMGADVVKIEPPGAGDPMRNWGQGDEKVQWEVIARNKRSVTCNLRVPEGQALAKWLISQADVLIENFKPGTLERWGLSPAELHAVNPGLIIARMSGYGQDGPPSRMGISIGDTLCATYGCKDGSYMIGGNGDAIFARLCQAMGQPELAQDERYSTHIARGHNQDALDALVNAWTATLTVDEVDALMTEYSILAGRVYRAPEMLADPHFQAREAIIEVETQQRGKIKMQNAFPKLSKTPSTIRRPAPAAPGQDNAEVFAERLGMGADELARLAEAGII